MCVHLVHGPALNPQLPPFVPEAGSVELRNAVSARFGVELPATITFDYPTAEALAGFLAERLAPAGQQAQQPRHAESEISSDAPLAPARLLDRWQQQDNKTEIIGWAASMASGGEPGTGERECCRCVAVFACQSQLLVQPGSVASTTPTPSSRCPLPQVWRSACITPRTASRLCRWSAGMSRQWRLQLTSCR